MSVGSHPRRRRTSATAALVVVPVLAVAGCGAAAQSAQSRRDSVQAELQEASAALRDSRSTSVTLHLDDPRGTLRKGLVDPALNSGDPVPAGAADVLLGGRVTVTVDPAGDRTLGEAQRAQATATPVQQLTAVNTSIRVEADGGSVAQLRLVGGDLYAATDLARVGDIARRSGSTTFDQELQQSLTSAPSQLQPLLQDVKAGTWVKLPLAPYADRLAAGGPRPSPSVDRQEAAADLVAAVRPYVRVTDANASSSKDRVLDVEVQARQAVKAVVDTLRTTMPAGAGLGQLDDAALGRIGEGTAHGQITLSGRHLRKVTLDLGSVGRLAPAAEKVPDLSGSTLTVDVDDAAGEVQAPADVSGVDVGQLVEQAVSTRSRSLRS